MEHDTLSTVLEHVGVGGTVFCRAELDAPWGVETRGTDSAIFHVAIRGSGYVRVKGGQPIAWRAGDLVLLPHGHAHIMSSSPKGKAKWIRSLPTEPSEDGLPCVNHPGDGARTSLLCGTFHFGVEAEDLLLGVLPPVLHVRGDGAASDWLDATLRLLANEVRECRPGATTVVTRLTEVLLVHALRSWMADEANSGGWLSALSDPVLGRALGHLHREPARDWTSADLAKVAGVSRSGLYNRFTDRLGQSPAAYLASWRMCLARRELEHDRSLAEVAESVGYASEAAFSRAFKRHTGASPRAWRRARS